MFAKRSKEEIIDTLEMAVQAYHSGLIPTVDNHEVHPDFDKSSRENYLYFTLPVSLNFQRSSPAMWKAAYATYTDPETQYLFYPEKIVEIPLEKIRGDLLKHKLALQQNKHPDIWLKISKALYSEYNSDPREIFSSNQRCVTRVKNCLVSNKANFPYLNGPKMSNYWLYILDQFTDIELQNRHKISIIPDTHVKQATKFLGITDSDDTTVIENEWFDLLKDTKWIPIDIHPVLWNWSRDGFKSYTL